MKYQLTNSEHIIKRTSDNACIPDDVKNSDYQEYLKWIEDGNSPLPADPLPEVRELTIQEKLQIMNINVEELKQLLGIS